MTAPKGPLCSGQIPPDVRSAADYARLARAALDPAILAHLDGGAGEEVTLRRNREAFERLAVTPRVLRRVREGHTRVMLNGSERPHPILLAPVAYQGLLHPGGELETARAAAAVEAPLVCSTLSSFPLEEIAKAGGGGQWFQLYIQPVWEVTLDLIRRAEQAGYEALVVTVDTPVQAPSLRSLRAGFRSEACEAANLHNYPPPPARRLARGESRLLQGMMGEAPAWDDLARVIQATALPVWVKGVLHPDDALEALGLGAGGLIVSNHGGRALDGAPAAITALPRIREAVGEVATVLLDGGIRSGADIFKAVALGADGVLVGRLQAYALAVAGALGVGHMVRLLREELELYMALASCETLATVRRAEVTPC